MSVPTDRIKLLNQSPDRADAKYVLYWMTSARRPRHNFAIDRALELSRRYERPLLVFEALRVDYPWASDRFHQFVIDGMRDNAADFASAGVAYYPYVEPSVGAGGGLLAALAGRACAVVTDDFPAFFLPRMVEKAAAALPVMVEAIDSNGVFPMRATDRVFPTAYSFRRFLQKQLPEHLEHYPRARPFSGAKRSPVALPRDVTKRWTPADAATLAGGGIEQLPIDHTVTVAPVAGGSKAARQALKRFTKERIAQYAERNQPEAEVTSGLSPYLHFGHLSSHEVLEGVLRREEWSPDHLSPETNGKRTGWWGLSEATEGFLDQIVTWRELGYNRCAHLANYDQYETLPPWALTTLEEHARDRREYTYSLSEFAAAQTHDSLWNAAQNQLVREGVIHNYLRMLWGKKILEWTKSPREALAVMVELNNRFALDGRNPNSYSGILWVLGLYDRAWGPERPIFGKIRYMSSENAARKLSVRGYVRRYTS